jgi:hypothetical protein
MRNKDLVYGWGLLANGTSENVVWRAGEPELLPGNLARDFSVSQIRPDGSLLGQTLRPPVTASVLAGREVKTLASLTQNLPSGSELLEVLDVASDGSVLVVGDVNRVRTFFRLRPIGK